MSNLKIDDRVQWMETKRTRGGFSFSTKYGTLKEIGSKGLALVQIRGGKRLVIAMRRLVSRDDPSPVNHVFGAMTADKTS